MKNGKGEMSEVYTDGNMTLAMKLKRHEGHEASFNVVKLGAIS